MCEVVVEYVRLCAVVGSSATFVAPLLLYELKKIGGKKFEWKKVRLFRRFKLFSTRTFFLHPFLFYQKKRSYGSEILYANMTDH